MGVWVFVVAYLVAFVLIQLVVYRYLRGREDEASVALARRPNADRGTARDPPDQADPNDRLDRRERPDDGGSTERRCPSCGASNQGGGAYTFCRNCTTRLPG